MRTKTVMWAFVILVAAGGLVWYYLSFRAAAPEVGRRAPAVTLADPAAGRTISLPADLAGKPFAIQFFAFTCPACRQEVMDLGQVVSEFEEAGLDFFVITLGLDEDISFLEENGMQGRILVDREAAAFRAYGIEVIPQTFFIDREGTIRAVKRGWTAQDSLMDFRRTAEGLLSGQ